MQVSPVQFGDTLRQLLPEVYGTCCTSFHTFEVVLLESFEKHLLRLYYYYIVLIGGVTQDVGSGTIGVKKCGKWDYRGEKMWEVGLSL